MQFANFAPALTVSESGGQITISWPVPATGYALESQTNLASGGWISVGDVPTTNGGTLSVVLPASGPQQFFRLKKP